MGEAVRSPDLALIQRIRALEDDVRTLRRLPTGQGSIGKDILTDKSVVDGKPFTSVARLVGSDESIPFNTTTVYNTFALDSQNGSMWNAGNTDRLTAQRTGWYLWTAWWFWAASAGGTRAITLLLNGAGTGRQDTRTPDTFNGSGGFVAEVFRLTATQYVGLAFYQNCTAGTALNVRATMSLAYLSE